MVQALGRKCKLFKMDVKSAFRLLPVSSDDFDQLGLCLMTLFYVDKCVPFDCSISCNLFNRFADALAHIIRYNAHSSNLMHYLDDFLDGGEVNSGKCEQLMQIFQQTMEQLGVPLAEDKTEDPVTVLIFLGLEIDSDKMEVRLPLNKVQDIISNLNLLLHKKRCTLKEMQSLIGSLNFA